MTDRGHVIEVTRPPGSGRTSWPRSSSPVTDTAATAGTITTPRPSLTSPRPLGPVTGAWWVMSFCCILYSFSNIYCAYNAYWAPFPMLQLFSRPTRVLTESETNDDERALVILHVTAADGGPWQAAPRQHGGHQQHQLRLLPRGQYPTERFRFKNISEFDG